MSGASRDVTTESPITRQSAFMRARSWLGWKSSGGSARSLTPFAANLRYTLSGERGVAEITAIMKIPRRYCVLLPESTEEAAAWARLAEGMGSNGSQSRCSSLACPVPPIVPTSDGGIPHREKPLLMCQRCRMAFYCDVACQKAHFPAHKEHCKHVGAILSAAGGGSVLKSLVEVRSEAFNRATLTFDASHELFAALTHAWKASALLVEMDDDVLARGGATPDDPLPWIATPFYTSARAVSSAIGTSAPSGGAGGGTAGEDALSGTGHALLARLRKRRLDLTVQKASISKIVDASIIVVFATHSGDCVKVSIIPVAPGFAEGYLAKNHAALVGFASFDAVAVEPCRKSEQRCTELESHANNSMQPIKPELILELPRKLRVCEVFGITQIHDGVTTTT